MSYYLVKIGTSGDASQQEVMDLFKSMGEDVIQTSGGLCLKSEKSIEDLKKQNEKLSSLTFLRVEMHEESEEISEDVRRFMNSDSRAQDSRQVDGP